MFDLNASAVRCGFVDAFLLFATATFDSLIEAPNFLSGAFEKFDFCLFKIGDGAKRLSRRFFALRGKTGNKLC